MCSVRSDSQAKATGRRGDGATGRLGFGRREFLLGAAALTACARPPAREATVTIARAPGYTQDLYDTVRRVLTEQRLAVRGRRVVLKPNLVEFEPGSVINTHPLVVHAALGAFRALGAADVRIAEGPGHRRNTLDLAEAAGYFQTIPGFEDLFTDLNLDEVSRVQLSRPSSHLNTLYLPRTALASDLLVSLPKMKTHHWAGATLSMKNLFGLVPGGVYGWPKNVLHWAGIHESIADLYRTFPRQFALVDGIVGMEGNGPIQGTAKAAGVLVAGRDLAAVDATCCRIMSIDPAKISYLQLAGVPERIVQAGERIDSVRNPFRLLPEFQSFRAV